VEGGTSLYREAVGLAATKIDKGRIRQKMHLELGRYWLDKNPNISRKSLERAVADSPGEVALRDQATELLREIPDKH
jgi:hypothetical protein